MQVSFDPTAARIREVYPYQVNLGNCDEEPLRHIQVIQPLVCLMGLHIPTRTLHYVSDNSDTVLGIKWETLLDRRHDEALPHELIAQIELGLTRPDGFETINPLQERFNIRGESVLKNVIVQRESDDYLIIEIEPLQAVYSTSNFQRQLSRAANRIQGSETTTELFARTVEVVRRLTNYDRVMVYQFDPEYNGEIIAESKISTLEPFLGLRYPHTDIPKQARELYLKNRIRIIGSTTDLPARLHSSDQAKEHYLDLSLAHARGVSPVHLEYLANMGVDSTMSMAIVLDGKLWGLIALHNHTPIFLDYSVRQFLLFLGEIVSGHLAIQAVNCYREESMSRSMVRSMLGEQILDGKDVIAGLVGGKYNVQSVLPQTKGAWVKFEDRTGKIGTVPSLELAETIVEFARQQPGSDLIYSNDNLVADLPEVAPYLDLVAGVLVAFIDPARRNFIIWFRPEISREIAWGGRPTKTILSTPDGSHRLSPRKSFARYVERVDGHSAPWTMEMVNAALALRNLISESVLTRYTEVRRLNDNLQEAYQELETFSYTVSHDLRSPLRAIDGFAEMLIEDYAHKFNEEARDLLVGIQRQAGRMNEFISDILELSRVGRVKLTLAPVSVNEVVTELEQEVIAAYGIGKKIVFDVADDIPTVMADRRMLRQVYLNLLTNAVKYAQPDEPGGAVEIFVGYQPTVDGEGIDLFVANRGSTIPARFHQSIFDMFSRLSGNEKVEGTGVGLAIVKRILLRHQGSIHVDPNYAGAKFVFSFGEHSPSLHPID